METRIFKHKIQWTASLSSGETLFEGKGDYEDVQDGRPSPYNRLLKYITENKLEIMSFGLYTEDGRTYHLPSISERYKIPYFNDEARPYDYNIFRYVESPVTGSETSITQDKIEKWFTVAEAFYTNFRVQIWVDERDTRNCRVHILPMEILKQNG